MKPKSDQSQRPPDTRLLRAGSLTTKIIKSLDRPFRPGSHEIAAMIQSICRTKKWSRSYLSAMMSVNAMDLHRWELGIGRPPPGVALRHIWLLYTMDTAPALAFSVLHIATWGKIEAKPMMIQHRLTGDERKKIIAKLKRAEPGEFTAPILAEKINCSIETARKIAIEAGYDLGDARKLAHIKPKLPNFLRPESVWLHVNWNHGISEIAKLAGVTERCAFAMKRKMRKVPPDDLKRHLRACGIDLSKYDAILKCNKNNKNNILLVDSPVMPEIQSVANEEKEIEAKSEDGELCSNSSEPGVSLGQEEGGSHKDLPDQCLTGSSSGA